MTDFLEQARRLLPTLSRIRRELHQYPELSWQEVRTTQLIEDNLRRLGVEIIPWGYMTGGVGLLRGAHPGRTVALRADIDALPLEEQNDVLYRSKNKGVMHACGHDAHVTCALGAAMILAGQAENLRGAVKFIFQPAEEKGGGARLLIDNGVLVNPDVNAIFALHCQPDLPVGSIGLRDGPLMAANDLIDIVVKGKGGHGAMPHQAKDALVASAAIIQALATLVTRGIDPLEVAVISFGKIMGGTARNVIPDSVELAGTVRTLNPTVRDALLPQIKSLAEQVAAAYGTQAEVSFPDHFPAVVNPAGLVDFCRRSLTELLCDAEIAIPSPVMLTEDFSQFQQKTPGVLLWLGVGKRAEGISYPLHSDRFDIGEDALAYGAAALAKLAYDCLMSDDRRRN
jgi:amidohydrolase